MVSPAILILPLYIYPITDAWKPLTKALAAYPYLTVQAIINPNNGPGDAPYPDDSYIPAIAGLNKFPNCQTLCYVHTSYGERDIAEVKADIDICAGWSNYKDADIHMAGIFFDEVSSTYNRETVRYLSSISSYAKQALAKTAAKKQTNYPVVFNPGVIVDVRFYALADYIIAFEDDYTNYSPSILQQIPAAVRNRSQFITYGFTGSVTDSAAIVQQNVAQGGLGGLFLSTYNGYDAFSSQFDSFARQMSRARIYGV